MAGLSTPKRLQRGAPAHNRAPVQEKEIAARLGGRVTKASGAMEMEKGDVRLHSVLRVEAKTTSNKSFSVTREMIDKIQNAALGAGELPCMEIEFLGPDGRPTHAIALVPTWVLAELRNE